MKNQLSKTLIVLKTKIVSIHTAEFLIEFVAEIKNGFVLKKILGTIHTSPRISEENKYKKIMTIRSLN